MMKHIIAEKGATPIGPFSHAVIANGFVFVSGQGPIHPETNKMPESFEDQVRQTLINIETILDAAGASLKDVVKVNTYLTDLSMFERYNQVYREFFPSKPPARATVAAELLGISIEIECIALLPQPE